MRGIYQLSDSDTKTDTDSLTLTLKITVELKRFIILRFLLMYIFIPYILVNYFSKIFIKKLSNLLTVFLILDKKNFKNELLMFEHFHWRFLKNFILKFILSILPSYFITHLTFNFYFYIKFIKII